MYKMGLVGLVH